MSKADRGKERDIYVQVGEVLYVCMHRKNTDLYLYLYLYIDLDFLSICVSMYIYTYKQVAYVCGMHNYPLFYLHVLQRTMSVLLWQCGVFLMSVVL